MSRPWSIFGAIAVLLAATLLLSAAGTALGEAERLPFDRKDSQRRAPTERPFAAMATNRSELRNLWDHSDQRGSLPNIRFERNLAILASLGGSGSCGIRGGCLER